MNDKKKQRHAYLLLIHEVTNSLIYMMKLLDDERNDFYIHIDGKAKQVSKSEITSTVTRSRVTFVRSVKVYWGHPSMVQAEMNLMKAAQKGGYDYYHILSGADMPIKSKAEIFAFFEKHNGKEFVHFGTEQYQKDIEGRYRQYHFFLKQLGRTWESSFWRSMQGYSLAIQRRLHIDRKKSNILYYGGTQWCSITDDFVRFCISFYKKHRGMFRWTQIPDEWMVQTMLMNSPFRENIYQFTLDNDYRACMRWIDWERGNPYVFRSEDLQTLIQCEYLFARKFDDRVDSEICKQLFEALVS